MHPCTCKSASPSCTHNKSSAVRQHEHVMYLGAVFAKLQGCTRRHDPIQRSHVRHAAGRSAVCSAGQRRKLTRHLLCRLQLPLLRGSLLVPDVSINHHLRPRAPAGCRPAVGKPLRNNARWRTVRILYMVGPTPAP